MDLDASLVIALIVVVLAGVITGLAGFGFGVVSGPPLLLLYDPPTVVVLGMILGWAGGWIPLLEIWREVQVRKLLRLSPWAVMGLIVGVVALQIIPALLLKLVASTVVVVFAAVLLRRPMAQSGEGRPWALPLAGLASGTLATSTGLGGPPVVLLFTLRGLPIHAFRASILAYLISLDAIGLPMLLTQGAVSRTHFLTGAILAPVAIVGRLVGMRVAHHVSIAAFRRFTLVLLIITGAVGIGNVLVTMVHG